MRLSKSVAARLVVGDLVLNLNYDTVFELSLGQLGRPFVYSPNNADRDQLLVCKPGGLFVFRSVAIVAAEMEGPRTPSNTRNSGGGSQYTSFAIGSLGGRILEAGAPPHSLNDSGFWQDLLYHGIGSANRWAELICRASRGPCADRDVPDQSLLHVARATAMRS